MRCPATIQGFDQYGVNNSAREVLPEKFLAEVLDSELGYTTHISSPRVAFQPSINLRGLSFEQDITRNAI